jgi:hypothetical protein
MDWKLEMLSKMNVIRIIRDDGIERALRLDHELKEFINTVGDKDSTESVFEEYKSQVQKMK